MQDTVTPAGDAPSPGFAPELAPVTTGADLQITEVPVPQPETLKPGECLVKLDCTGVCHTDLHAAKGDWPIPAKTPLIGGHEVRRHGWCAQRLSR